MCFDHGGLAKQLSVPYLDANNDNNFIYPSQSNQLLDMGFSKYKSRRLSRRFV